MKFEDFLNLPIGCQSASSILDGGLLRLQREAIGRWAWVKRDSEVSQTSMRWMFNVIHIDAPDGLLDGVLDDLRSSFRAPGPGLV